MLNRKDNRQEMENNPEDINNKAWFGGQKLDCISSSRIDAHKNMPCRSLAHLSMAHSPLEWKRLKADVWRCDMFETWWWCLLHCKAYDFLSLHIFLCKFFNRYDGSIHVMNIWKYGLSHSYHGHIFIQKTDIDYYQSIRI